MTFSTAVRNIHADPFWWRKVLTAGALTLAVFGAPWAAGLVVESMDNVRKGYPTPLPPNTDASTRFIIGLLALVTDFFFFVFPTIALGLVFLCVVAALALGQSAAGGGQNVVPLIIGLFVLIYMVIMFALGVSPVGRLIYAEEGRVEQALSARTLRKALDPSGRRSYTRARLHSLPGYLPLVVLSLATWASVDNTLPAGWILTAVLLWLTLSALVYAHLIVAQLYGDAERHIW